jgi:hypothetical protein
MTFIGTVCTYLVLVIFLGYLLPHLFVVFFYKTRNLKKAYNATWAIVTGSSSGATFEQMTAPLEIDMFSGNGSLPALLAACPPTVPPYPPPLPLIHIGIGKALAKRLAAQGLNVVLAALGDDLLDTTFEELQQLYPKVAFRKVEGRGGGLPLL